MVRYQYGSFNEKSFTLNIPYQNPGGREIVSISSSISFLHFYKLTFENTNKTISAKGIFYWIQEPCSTNVYSKLEVLERQCPWK